MKTLNSPEDVEGTSSKKKLKQARLPFKLLSDVSPIDERPQTRKRKLSATETEPVTKIGKVTKENDNKPDLVVISDDDSKDVPNLQKEDKPLNPYVKLVDNVLKKKLQKSKSNKNKNPSKSAQEVLDNGEHKEMINHTNGPENMEVDCTENQDKVCLDKKPIVNVNQGNNIKNKTEMKSKETFENSEMNNIKVTNEVIDLEEYSETLEHQNKEVTSDTQNNENKSLTDAENETTLGSPVTPKRSSRKQTKNEESKNLNTSQSSICDSSISSNSTTPKRNLRSSSVTKSQGDISLNDATNLTPKQLQKKLESAKKKEEKEREKQERDRKRQEEKEERVKQKQEKEEQKKREREEKEEQKRKEKEEKERQKELEKKLKEEREEQKRKEREEKEELRKKEKEAREEEKRKKQEALELEKQEQEQKKKKAAEAFVNFFVQKQKTEKDQSIIVSKNDMLSSFTIKADMRLAPAIRNNLSDQSKVTLDKFLKEQNVPDNLLYIKSLRDSISKPMHSGKTWPLNEKEDDEVMIIEDDLPPVDSSEEIITCEPTIREKLRPKLLSFHENRRPPYWGTWRKKSVFINARRPFHQDQKQLDYDVDSDEEWEEEQEGESIDGSAAGSDEEQDADEYEVDNEVFVPHGYLSDEEATMDEDDVLSLSPETQKARLKHLEDEFESELKKPTEKLKPRMYGLLWEMADGKKPEKCVDALWQYFQKLSMIMNDPTSLLQPSNEPEELDKKKIKKKKSMPEAEKESPVAEKKKKPKQENKEAKKIKMDSKKKLPEMKKHQPGINSFLTILKSP